LSTREMSAAVILPGRRIVTGLSAYVSVRQHTYAYVSICVHARCRRL
jgi:hypothetical protein